MGSLPTIQGSLLELISKAPELAQTGSDELYRFESPEGRFIEVAMGDVDGIEITQLNVTLRTPTYENHVAYVQGFFGSPDDASLILHPSKGKYARIVVTGSSIPFFSSYSVSGTGISDRHLGKILHEMGLIPSEKEFRRSGRTFRSIQLRPEQAQSAFGWASSYQLDPLFVSQSASTAVCVTDHPRRYRSYTLSLRDATANEVDGLERFLSKEPFNLDIANTMFVPKLPISDQGSIEPQTSA